MKILKFNELNDATYRRAAYELDKRGGYNKERAYKLKEHAFLKAKNKFLKIFENSDVEIINARVGLTKLDNENREFTGEFYLVPEFISDMTKDAEDDEGGSLSFSIGLFPVGDLFYNIQNFLGIDDGEFNNGGLLNLSFSFIGYEYINEGDPERVYIKSYENVYNGDGAITSFELLSRQDYTKFRRGISKMFLRPEEGGYKTFDWNKGTVDFILDEMKWGDRLGVKDLKFIVNFLNRQPNIDEINENYEYSVIGDDGEVNTVTADEFIELGSSSMMNMDYYDIDDEKQTIVVKFSDFNKGDK